MDRSRPRQPTVTPLLVRAVHTHLENCVSWQQLQTQPVPVADNEPPSGSQHCPAPTNDRRKHRAQIVREEDIVEPHEIVDAAG